MTESKGKVLREGEILRVEIEKVAHGGHFIARHEGAVIFVRHAIPGEIVEVEITGVEKSFARARVVAVIEASPSRRQPPCHVSLQCGGCDFQHIDPARQRELKSEVIAEQFARIAKMEIDVEVEEVSSPLHWRTRYAATSNSRGEIGFIADRSNDVVPTPTCPVLIPEIDISTLPTEKIAPGKRVEVALSTQGERSIAVLDTRKSQRDQRSQAELVEGKSSLTYTVNEFSYRVSQESFWQSNINAPEVLVDAVLDFADLQEGDHFLDLYGGVGLFTAAALLEVGPGGRVDLFEGSTSATADAKRNFHEATNLNIHIGDVAREIKSIKRADVIVLDPPRAGAGRAVIEKITAMKARSIIYVACDPASLARDTGYLNELGYHLEDIRSFDLFPMTHHIESVALYTPREVS